MEYNGIKNEPGLDIEGVCGKRDATDDGRLRLQLDGEGAVLPGQGF